MRLCVVDHLHAVFDGPQKPIGSGERARDILGKAAGGKQRADGVECCRRAQRQIAAAVDHLLNLHEELDFPNAAAPALEVVARSDMRTLSEVVADARRNLAHVFDDAEVERAAPDKWMDRIEESLTERTVAGGGAGADEGRSLPRQSARFIMRDGGVHGQGNGRDLGRRPEAQVDPLDIAIRGPLLEYLNHTAGNPHRSVRWIVATAPRKRLGVE